MDQASFELPPAYRVERYPDGRLTLWRDQRQIAYVVPTATFELVGFYVYEQIWDDRLGRFRPVPY